MPQNIIFSSTSLPSSCINTGPVSEIKRNKLTSLGDPCCDIIVTLHLTASVAGGLGVGRFPEGDVS